MKALVVLENHFYVDCNKDVWCDRVVDYNFLKRYLDVFSEIVVAGRTQYIDKIDKSKLLVSGEKVEFIALPEFIGAKGLIKNLSKIKKLIRYGVNNTDCAIYRAPTHLSLFTYKEVIKSHKPLALEFMMAADKMIDGDNFIKKILNKVIKIKAKKMCMKANGVSYVTESILQSEYPCRAIKKENGKKYFTTSYSSIDLDESDYYRQNWISDDKPEKYKIIHTGYMDSYRKGQDTLIRAAKIVADKGYNIEITLIGDGEKRKEFECLVKDLGIENIVKFQGLIKSKKEVLEYLRNSHLLVFPTHSEGLPRTIIEAMSQGLPCISSPVDGIPELLDKEFMVDYNDADGYAIKIEELLNNWNKMIEISNKNYEKSLNYGKKILSERRKDFYKKIKELGDEKNAK